jgi:hypothetical protein
VVSETAASLAERMAGLSPAADALKAASARDSAGATRRLAERLSMTQTELAQRKVDATAGAQFAKQQARARFRSTKSDLKSRLRGIAQEEGVFAQARAGELEESRRDRRTTRRGQTLTARERARDRAARREEGVADRALEREKMSQQERAEKESKMTPKEQRDAVAAIRRAASARKTYGSMSPATLKAALGVGEFKAPDQATGELETVKVPRIDDPLYVRAGFELASKGYISGKTRKALRGQGVRIPKGMRLKRPSGPAFDRATNQSPGSDRAQG